MSSEHRQQDRASPIVREEWITRFVNVVIWELRPGTERMVAVQAAREAWARDPAAHPRDAVRSWISTLPAG